MPAVNNDVPIPPPSPAGGRPAHALRLDVALQLLQQSGHAGPSGEPGSTGWMQSLVDALVDLTSRDALTGLANRRSFELALAREIDRVARSGEPALLLALDIDHFKRVNDTHGHAAGDLVIRAVGRALQDSVRPMDLVARVGGEEFGIVLPNCPAAFGPQVAERVRARVERSAVQIKPGQSIAVTVSIGGAFAPQWVRTTPRLWMDRADLQLYRAKGEGRNRSCLEQAAVSQVSAEEKTLLFATSQWQELT
jgi:diguanylate cyclase (GGDEF)-like protein